MRVSPTKSRLPNIIKWKCVWQAGRPELLRPRNSTSRCSTFSDTKNNLPRLPGATRRTNLSTRCWTRRDRSLRRRRLIRAPTKTPNLAATPASGSLIRVVAAVLLAISMSPARSRKLPCSWLGRNIDKAVFPASRPVPIQISSNFVDRLRTQTDTKGRPFLNRGIRILQTIVGEEGDAPVANLDLSDRRPMQIWSTLRPRAVRGLPFRAVRSPRGGPVLFSTALSLIPQQLLSAPLRYS